MDNEVTEKQLDDDKMHLNLKTNELITKESKRASLNYFNDLMNYLSISIR